ncbi:MAG: hypothetical protein WC506_06160 [Candidatus Micrarchaeia archaeon]
MDMKLFFALLIAAMLFLGCAQQQPPAPPAQGENTTVTPPAPPAENVTQPAAPPALSVDVVSQTNMSSITVAGVTDKGAFVTVNGAAANVADDGTFTADVALVEGENTLVIASENNAGLKTTATKTVTYAKPAPPVAMDDSYVPANGVVSTTDVPLYVAVGVTPSNFNSTPGRVEFLNVLPGSTSVATLQLTNSEDSPVHIEFKVSGDAGNMVNPTPAITLFKKGEVRAVQISLTVPAGTIYGSRTGTISLVETRGQAS